MATNRIFLFSVDLEDVRTMIPGGEKYKKSLPRLMPLYMDLLNKYKFKCTFFVVGQTARQYPDLIKQLVLDGHEIACHSNLHKPLDCFNEKEFLLDLENNISSLESAGAKDIIGFRAPTLSLTNQTNWAYKALAKCGIKYSSSVLPADNPLYGWKEFGTDSKQVDHVLELPVTISQKFPLKWPFASGTYFRLLPFFVTKQLFKEMSNNNQPIIGYFHPYDIDTEQEKFMHPGLNNSKAMNRLMYINRSRVIPRLDKILSLGYEVCTYKHYLDRKKLI